MFNVSNNYNNKKQRCIKISSSISKSILCKLKFNIEGLINEDAKYGYDLEVKVRKIAIT